MDADRFDLVVKALAVAGGRRQFLHFLSALPFVAALGSLPDDEGATASRHRQRRKAHPQSHERVSAAKKRKKKKHKQRKKPVQTCTPQSLAQTCEEKCGQVRNNCHQTVDCGSCACEGPCPVCQICDETSGTCVPDAIQRGDACGEIGQVCQADGACACDGDSCGGCATCQGDGTCSTPCNGTGCCSGGICFSGDTNAI
jgi:hypothetical protein